MAHFVKPEPEDDDCVIISDEEEEDRTSCLLTGDIDLRLSNLREEELTYIECPVVRLGSYKFTPKGPVVLSSLGVKIPVPSFDDKECIPLFFPQKYIRRVLIYFGEEMPISFLYFTSNVGPEVQKILRMKKETGPYFDPDSNDEAEKRIILMPRKFSEDNLATFKIIFYRDDRGENKLEELDVVQTNNLASKALPNLTSGILPKCCYLYLYLLKEKLEETEAKLQDREEQLNSANLKILDLLRELATGEHSLPNDSPPPPATGSRRRSSESEKELQEVLQQPSTSQLSELQFQESVIRGYYTLCCFCGFLSRTNNSCQRCQRFLPPRTTWQSESMPPPPTTAQMQTPTHCHQEDKMNSPAKSAPSEKGTPKKNGGNEECPTRPSSTVLTPTMDSAPSISPSIALSQQRLKELSRKDAQLEQGSDVFSKTIPEADETPEEDPVPAPKSSRPTDKSDSPGRVRRFRPRLSKSKFRGKEADCSGSPDSLPMIDLTNVRSKRHCKQNMAKSSQQKHKEEELPINPIHVATTSEKQDADQKDQKMDANRPSKKLKNTKYKPAEEETPSSTSDSSILSSAYPVVVLESVGGGVVPTVTTSKDKLCRACKRKGIVTTNKYDACKNNFCVHCGRVRLRLYNLPPAEKKLREKELHRMRQYRSAERKRLKKLAGTRASGSQ